MDVSKLRELASYRYDDFVDGLREMVHITAARTRQMASTRIADLCQHRFEEHGWKVERTPHHPGDGERELGDVLVGRLEGAGGPRVLLIGRMDNRLRPGDGRGATVHRRRPARQGPGVSHLKSRQLLGFFAVEVLQEAGAGGFGRITYVCNPDEEIGSQWSASFIKREAAEADVAFVLESGRENGDIVSARKASRTTASRSWAVPRTPAGGSAGS